MRLQVSEFLKCSLLLFVENYYRDRMLFDQNILTYLTTVLVECSRKSIERVSEIESNLAFHRSLYSTHHVTSEFSTPSEVSTLWATCRTVRKGLYSSLVLWVLSTLIHFISTLFLAWTKLNLSWKIIATQVLKWSRKFASNLINWQLRTMWFVKLWSMCRSQSN